MNQKELYQKIKKQHLYFDGGMGTLLQAAGLPVGESPEMWNISHPEVITEIHKRYIAAGANFITTNTFGLAQRSDEDILPIATAAMKCARDAIQSSDTFIAFDIGPLGKLLQPFGTFPFEAAVQAFTRCAKAADNLGADVIIIETMNDALETKAALLAAKENSNLPVIVSNAYDATGKLVTGANPQAMVAMLEGLGADVIGVNCSLGPKSLLPIVKEYMTCASVPVIVSPNAGLPIVVNGETHFDISPLDFAKEMVSMAEAGALILGGCCGTTPDYIRETVRLTSSLPVQFPTQKEKTVVSSYTHAVTIGEISQLIGERINPTGKKKIKEALQTKNDDYILSEGLRQVDAGVAILDVNAGLPGIDEGETLCRLITKLQGVTDVPLQIDTADPEALEKALRAYAGKPLLNSVNGKKESLSKVLPLAKKYGAAVIGLTLDENGIPDTAEGRLTIARRIVEEAEKMGIHRKNIIIDPLALTISSDQNSANVTLEAIRLIKKELHVATSLGVSNISFGLPERDRVNAAFYTMALAAGLDLAIMNPFSETMMAHYRASLALLGKDPACETYIATACTLDPSATASSPEKAEMMLSDSIIRGLSDHARSITEAQLAQGRNPLEIIEQDIVGGLGIIGERFEKGTAYLPQLLTAADAASAAFAVIKEHLPQDQKNNHKIVLATVKGDIHDIGKNIVKVLLENFGFTVIDLGKDVPPEVVVEAASDCKLVGLSALMTTTVPAMEETIRLLHKTHPETKVVVGGAVLTQDYADTIGADFYAKDAMETVRIAQKIFKQSTP